MCRGVFDPTKTAPRIARRIACTALSLAIAASSALAQGHNHGWIVCGRGLTSPSAAVARIAPPGARATIVSNGAFSGDVLGGAMDADNDGFVVTWSPSLLFGASGLNRVDRSGAVTATLVDSNAIPWLRFTDVTIGSDGQYLVTAAPGLAGVGSLFRIDGAGRVQTILAGPPLDWPIAITLDVHRDRIAVLDTSPARSRVISIAPDGNATAVLATLPTPGLGQIAYDVLTDGYYIGASTSQPPGAVVLHLDAAGRVTTVLASGPPDATAVAVDRASATPRLVWFGTGPFGRGLFAFDPTSQAITTVSTSSFYAHDQIVADRSRNLAPRALGNDRWTINLAVPGEPNARYVIALSLSGVVPGVLLADGRPLAFNPDPITATGLTGLLGTRWSGSVGTLNATGRAAASLNVDGLPVRGLAIWVIAVTFDTQAPLGLRTIVDPIAIRL